MDDVSKWTKIKKEIRKELHVVTKLQWARPVYSVSSRLLSLELYIQQGGKCRVNSTFHQ